LPELKEILNGFVAKEQATQSAQQEATNQLKLKQDYDKLKAKLASQLTFFPPFHDYLEIASIKPQWAAAKKDYSKELDQAKLEAEITVLAESIEKTVYSNVIEAHAKAEFLPGGASKAGFDVVAAEEDDEMVLLGRVTAALPCPHLGCGVWATFPAILEHACTDHVLRATYQKAAEYKFADNPLATTGENVAAIRMILGAAGEREKTAAVETLDELSWKLTCKGCPKVSNRTRAPVNSLKLTLLCFATRRTSSP